MFRPSRTALAATALSLAASVFAMPVAAYAADTTTNLSATQMAAALKTVATTSTAAAAGGWQTTIGLTGFLSLTGSSVVDTQHKTAVTRVRFEDELMIAYVAGGRGAYLNLGEPDQRAAVQMMGRPEVKFVFAADPTLNFDTLMKENGPGSVLADSSHAGTKTVHDDGSADYRFTGSSGEMYTFRVATSGSLTRAHVAADGLAMTQSFVYGPQTVTLPAAAITISAATLNRGVAYLHMSDAVRAVAKGGAEVVRGKAHGRRVKVSSLRKIIKHDAKVFNTKLQVKLVKVKNIRRGVKVYAKNPWTHKTVSYTVKAFGRKVVVRKTKAAAAGLAAVQAAGTAHHLPADLPAGWLDGLFAAAVAGK
ncbi:hypothetical protein EV385_1326 [Krasilnikovia cinnamomea]|uniref:Uncharacterized protein n=1 Tax=Krasilnikovia cinnamomea TaxID=349313 RepID=A0A4Q7ZH90_9ACTN|nr:hypothetical protein [Krasilnikovia cinnamomea]RZU49573.1 hypothetical protein EV385_1326 [Krasilnikovia cinnamomea]